MNEREIKFFPEGWNYEKKEYNISELKNAKNENSILDGIVYECDLNSNLKINLGNNIIGIIPKNEVDIISSDEFGITSPNICKNKINQVVQFKVKEIYKENEVLLSRKDAEKDIIDWLKNDLSEGAVVNGIVKNIRKFGAFIDIGGGIVGLLHIEDISISRIKSPDERFKIGQKVKVVIKSIDKDTNKVVLSHKELLGNWDENVQEYQEKMIVDRNSKRS